MSDTPQWESGSVLMAVGKPGQRRADDIVEEHLSVNAMLYGPFAVHESRNSYGWTVTHRHQGRLLHDGIENRAAARWLCEQLFPLLQDWSSVKPGDIPQEIRGQFVALIKEMQQ